MRSARIEQGVNEKEGNGDFLSRSSVFSSLRGSEDQQL